MNSSSKRLFFSYNAIFDIDIDDLHNFFRIQLNSNNRTLLYCIISIINDKTYVYCELDRKICIQNKYFLMIKSDLEVMIPTFYSTLNKIEIMKFLHEGKVLINEDNLIFYLNTLSMVAFFSTCAGFSGSSPVATKNVFAK